MSLLRSAFSSVSSYGAHYSVVFYIETSSSEHFGDQRLQTKDSRQTQEDVDVDILSLSIFLLCPQT